MLKNINDAEFYIDNRRECRYCPDDLAYTFVGLKIKRPAEYDLSLDYVVDLVRNGTDIKDIKKMLKESNNEDR